MKRKRSSVEEKTRSRPFQLRVELLNECLSLCLRYNREFNYDPTDLSLYRYAETIVSQNDLSTFKKKMEEAIENRQELTSI